MIARDIVQLLERRHSDDLFIPECKDGPTHGGGHARLDAWAMAKSWTRPSITGYEVKISRGDFLQDNKWPSYLPMCNQLFFVCPTGLIQPPEVPDHVGLLWASKTGGKLYTKKKATYREIPFPEDTIRYVLMARVRVTREYDPTGDRRQFWADWLRDRKLNREFGYKVSRTLATRIREEIDKVQSENERLREENGRYEDIRKLLHALDIDPRKTWMATAWQVRQRLEEARSVLPDGLIRDLRAIAHSAEHVAEKLAELEALDVPDEALG